MLRRQDYEQMPTPRSLPGPQAIEGYPGTGIQLGAWCNGDERRVMLSVFSAVLDCPLIAALNKEKVDDIIRDLIAARNHLWPTP